MVSNWFSNFLRSSLFFCSKQSGLSVYLKVTVTSFRFSRKTIIGSEKLGKSIHHYRSHDVGVPLRLKNGIGKLSRITQANVYTNKEHVI